MTIPDFFHRILLAKLGLCGYAHGVKAIARPLCDSGMEAVHSG